MLLIQNSSSKNRKWLDSYLALRSFPNQPGSRSFMLFVGTAYDPDLWAPLCYAQAFGQRGKISLLLFLALRDTQEQLPTYHGMAFCY
jgi:hypothetical protein